MAKEAKLITLKNLEAFGLGLQDQIDVDLKALAAELKAFVGNKQITYLTQAEYDVLGDADKNDENRVFIITDKVEEEVASKEAFDELQNAVDEVTGNVTGIQEELANKVNQSDLNNTLANYSSTEQMNQAINNAVADKADASDITALNNEIDRIDGELANKLEADDLNNINQSITNLTNEFNNYSTTEEVNGLINAAVEDKATTGALDAAKSELNTAIQNVDKKFEDYATNDDLVTLEGTIATKADASALQKVEGDVSTLSGQVAALDQTFVKISEHDQQVANINAAIAAKAAQADLESLTNRVVANETFVANAPTTYVKVADHEQQVSDINDAIATKANAATVNTLSEAVETHATFITNAPATFAAKSTVDDIISTDLPSKADASRVADIEAARVAENTVSEVAVAEGKALLTDRKLQKVTGLVEGTELVLPAATNFMEMRVFMAVTQETNIVCSALSEGLTLEANCAYELRFVHVDTMIGWLVSIIEFDTTI